MRQKLSNTDNGLNKLVSKLAAEKKKSIVAFCLIVVMVFMWARVLASKAPQTAEAAAGLEPAQASANPELKISFIELPNLKGRNDTLTRDFFTVNDWRDFLSEGQSKGGIGEVSIVSRGDNEEYVRTVAKKLRLEAIALSRNPQAFINDKLLAVGDKLFVADGADAYECEVVEIKENMVLIRCGKAEITLKLTHEVEVGD